MRVKQLFRNCNNSVPSTDWNEVVKALVTAYSNKVFFNQSLFGGNKNTFDKLRKNALFNF